MSALARRIWSEISSADFESLLKCAKGNLPPGQLVLVIVRVAFEANRSRHEHPVCSLPVFVDKRRSVRAMLADVREALWCAHAQPCGFLSGVMSLLPDGYDERCVLRSPTHTWALYSPVTSRPLLPFESTIGSAPIAPPLDFDLKVLPSCPPSIDGAAHDFSSNDMLLDSPVGQSELVVCEERSVDELCAEYRACMHTCRFCATRYKEKQAKCEKIIGNERSNLFATTYRSLIESTDTLLGTASCRKNSECICVVDQILRSCCTSMLRIVAVPSPADFSTYLLFDGVFSVKSLLTGRYFARVGCDVRHVMQILLHCRNNLLCARSHQVKAQIAEPSADLHLVHSQRYNEALAAACARHSLALTTSFTRIAIATNSYLNRDILMNALRWLVPACAWLIRYVLAAFEEYCEIMHEIIQSGQFEENREREMFSEFRSCNNRRLVIARVLVAYYNVPSTAAECLRNGTRLALLIHALAIYESLYVVKQSKSSSVGVGESTDATHGFTPTISSSSTSSRLADLVPVTPEASELLTADTTH